MRFPQTALFLLATALVVLAAPDADAGRRRGGGAPDIQAPTSLDFGSVPVGTTSTLQLQIDNVGTGVVLSVTNIVSDEPAFVPQQTTASILPGENALIDVDFTPPSIAAFSGTLTITSNDPDEPTVVVALSGNGVPAVADIQVPASLDFGPAPLGSTVTMNLQIDNVGSSTLTVTGVGSSDPAVFLPRTGLVTIVSLFLMVSAAGGRGRRGRHVTWAVAAVLAALALADATEAGRRRGGALNIQIPAGSSALMPVDFTPVVLNSYAETLTLVSDDPDESVVQITLTGEGIHGPVAVFMNPAQVGVGVGGTAGRLQAFYLLSDGNLVEATSAAGNLPSFSSSDPSVVSVETDGLMVAVGQGTAIVTAMHAGLSAQTVVTVGPASTHSVSYSPANVLVVEVGEAAEFTVNTLFPLSDAVDVLSSNPAVLSVGPLDRLGSFARADVTGVAPGSADLTIRSQTDPTKEKVVEIHVVGLTSVSVSPASLGLAVSDVASLTGMAVGSDGTWTFAIPDEQVTWSSNLPATAPIFPNGKVVGLAVGSATVTATSVSSPGLSGNASVTVTAPAGLPDTMLTDLVGADIVAAGVAYGNVVYGRDTAGGGTIASAPSVEKVFLVENAATATAPLEVVFTETDTDRLMASASSGSIAPDRIGGLVIEVTLPDAVVGTSESNLGPTSGTVTVYTNDPANHQLDVPVTWSWQSASGVQPDASVRMFLDFGDVSFGAIKDRTFFFDTESTTGQVTNVTVAGAGFALVSPNPNPFMADAFPESQINAGVPLTFTLRAAPNATSGTFLGTVSFTNNDPDEPSIEALVVVYGAPADPSPLPADLATATVGETTRRTLNGSEQTLIPIPSGGAGLEQDGPTGTVYGYSSLAVLSDPNAAPNAIDFYLFKMPSGARPQLISDTLTDGAVGLGVDFSSNLMYIIDVGLTTEDLIKVTDAGSISIINTGGFTSAGRIGVDANGDVYVSRVIKGSLLRLRKFSPAGSELLAFAGSQNIRTFDLANVLGVDTLYTDLGTKLDTSGTQIGNFVLVPDFEWLAVDPLGNVLFADGSGLSSQPQDLTLEDPSGNLTSAGQLPLKSVQGDF